MKALYNEPYFNHRDFILCKVDELDINSNETLLLLIIDYLNEHQMIINYEILATKMKLSQNDIDELINSLINKNYLEIKMHNRTIDYCIDGVFKLDKEAKIINKNDYSNLFDLYEESFGRPLTQNESQRISEWMSKYDFKLIEYALKESIVYEKRSFDYINAILNDWDQRKFSSEAYERGDR